MRTAFHMLAGTLLVAAAATAIAETRHADAHVHGSGSLNFAIGDQKIHLELMAHSDILGFGLSSTDAQRQQLKKTLTQLETSSLWVFPASARCTLVEADSGVGEHDDHDHDDHDHDDDHGDHDHDHDSHDNDHDEHDEDHDHHEHGHDNHDNHDAHQHSEGHIDISATYVYKCEQVGKVDSIQTTYFRTFTNAEKLTVQGDTAKKQVSDTMTRTKPEVNF